MMSLDAAVYLRRLNDSCAQALAAAAGLCETRGHRDIEIEHWLIKLLEAGDHDLLSILRRYQIDIEPIWNGLLSALERLPHELRGKPGLSHHLNQWLQSAWLRASVRPSSQPAQIRGADLLAALVEQPHLLKARDAWALLTVSASQIERLVPELDTVSADQPASSTRSPASDPAEPLTVSQASAAAASALSRFTADITHKAREGRIDPVFGRELEIRQMIDILVRRRKNNPLLVGEPGVGKTALVEGLALKIIEGEVPATLRQVSVLTLDLGLMQAGAGVKGEFEQRLKNVVTEVQAASTPILLFIDEAHTLIGAGNVAGSADAANLLKPALARGELRTIAATTWSEYKQYFERDAALERRFQRVKVDEPDDAHACLMLRGLKDRYAQHHAVHISDAAVTAAVQLSRRYLTGRQLPDKAVDLLDTAAARVRMSMDTTPPELARCQAESRALSIERQALQQDQGLIALQAAERLGAIEQHIASHDAEQARLNGLLSRQRELVAQLQSIRGQWQSSDDQAARLALEASIKPLQLALQQQPDLLVRAEVDEAAIASVIADWTGIPAGTLLEDERSTLLELDHRLGEVVVGQDDALAALARRLRAAKAGLTSEQAPLGVFLLVGPSGVGKTETARALAELMFGGERALLTINLSEYQEAHTVSQLKGSPPGYVGYGQGGVLTEAVRQRPYSVILLDEVEKAHRDVLNLFYQVFDRGFMRDGEGRSIDFRNTVLVMTSNLGSQQILDAAEVAQVSGTELSSEQLLEAIRPQLLDHFQAPLLARFQTVVYRPLSSAALATIVRMKLDKVAQRISQQFAAVTISDQALVDALVTASQLPDAGARHIDRLLEQQILPALSRELLLRHTQTQRPSTIRLGYNLHDGVTIEFEIATGQAA